MFILLTITPDPLSGFQLWGRLIGASALGIASFIKTWLSISKGIDAIARTSKEHSKEPLESTASLGALEQRIMDMQIAFDKHVIDFGKHRKETDKTVEGIDDKLKSIAFRVGSVETFQESIREDISQIRRDSEHTRTSVEGTRSLVEDILRKMAGLIK